MSSTSIFTTRKLEKTVKGFLTKEVSENEDSFGGWVANLFHVSHKKCWILIHQQTKYILVFPNIRKPDLEDISTVFKEAFYGQLIYDGIFVDYDFIDKIIGDVNLRPTNNDRSSLGILNYCLENFDEWKKQYVTFENMPFRDLNNRLNRIPYSFLKLKYPKEEMSVFLNELT
jgi:hypothetical protein